MKYTLITILSFSFLSCEAQIDNNINDTFPGGFAIKLRPTRIRDLKMKRLGLMIISALILGFILNCCKKDSDIDLRLIEGTYVGNYTTTGPELSSKTAPTIEFKNGEFTCNGLSNGGYHDIQSGNFTITDNKIIFDLTRIEHDPSVPDVDFILAPWHDDWLLKGEYEYKIDNNKLAFSKTAIVLDKEYKFEFEFIKNK